MNHSYWLESQTPTPTSAQRRYDILIIGAGIAGLSTAYWLHRRDSRLKIGILEKRGLGSGASGRNAGFVTCGSTEHFIKLKKQFGLTKATEIWKFSEQNRELLREHIIQDRADKIEYRNTGSCTVAPGADHWAQYQTIAKEMKSAGIDVYEVDPRELEDSYGILGFEGGIQYKGDGYVHPIKLLNLFRERTRCDIHESTEVRSLSSSSLSPVVVQTDRGNFEADHAVLTVNAYLPLVLPEYGKFISPGRGQILLTEPLPFFVKGPCYLTKYLCYFRQLPNGQLLVGGFRNLATETEKTYDENTTDAIQGALYEFVKSHFKYGPQARISHKWSGIMGFTTDGQMVMGSPPRHPRISFMAGCSGHGMGLSFNAARFLVGHLFNEAIPEHLRWDRPMRPSQNNFETH